MKLFRSSAVMGWWVISASTPDKISRTVSAPFILIDTSKYFMSLQFIWVKKPDVIITLKCGKRTIQKLVLIFSYS